MIEIAFEWGINLVESFIAVDFVTRYLGTKYKGAMAVFGFIAVWLIYMLELCITNSIVPYEGVGAVIPIITTFIYSIFFLNGSTLLKLWISSLIGIIITLIAIITNLLVCTILGYDPLEMITVFNSIRIISVIITKIILFYSSRVILKFKHGSSLSSNEFIKLIVIPLVSLISISSLMMAAIKNDGINGYMLCGTFGILLSNIITYYFFSVLDRHYETELKLKMIELHKDNAVKELESSKAFVNRMRKAKHDMKNQLTVISEFINEKKYQQAQDYINEISDRLPYKQSFVNSENDAFNAIVNSKISICDSKQIYFDIQIMRSSLSDFNAVDVGMLFGNLLDNAIEAADKTESRKISVDIQNTGNYLSIIVSNSIDSSVIQTNPTLETTKKNKSEHGMGTKIIRDIVKKYDGMIQFFERDNNFCCHILLDTKKLQQYK